MAASVCSVCGKPGTRMIGLRWFCEEHYQKATHERKHTWLNLVLLVLGMLVFVGLVTLFDPFLKPALTGSTLLLAGVVLALIPAGIWMIFFYLQDRLEPEPKGYVLAVFILGALLAAAVGVPLLDGLFRISNWLYVDTAVTILGGILVVGFTQEFLKYAAVRYSIYLSSEFDEPTDGVIYATAAGLGYATVLNIQFFLASGGASLGSSALRMAVIALAQASFAGITGYFLGRAKFEHKPVWWMPLGLTLAAIVNGLFNWLRMRVVQGGFNLSGSTANPVLGFILAAVVACVTTGIIFWLVRRNIRSALAGK